MTERPLDQIKREVKAANRAPHLRKKNFTGTDPIDVLDNVGIGGAYHHDGPYDATLASRNRDERYAPVAAVRETNLEALKATPRDRIQDSLVKHLPLQGTATIPPGEQDYSGRTMDYEEGADLMREADSPGGPYRRYDHVPKDYHPDDLKGKGEPSYTVELREKRHRNKSNSLSNGSNAGGVYEMGAMPHASRSHGHSHDSKSGSGAPTTKTRSRGYSASSPAAGPSSGFDDSSNGHGGSGSGGKFGEGIKRRFGSLRHKRNPSTDL